MKRVIMNIILILSALALFSCNAGREGGRMGGKDDSTNGENMTAGNGAAGAESESPNPTPIIDSHDGQTEPDIRVKMTAVVDEVGDRLEVTVTESEYTFGIFWVITPDSAVYLDADGNSISRADIKAGDTVEIWYSGQVMLSYPPQIVAHKIILK